MDAQRKRASGMTKERASQIAQRLLRAADVFRERDPYPDQHEGGSVWWPRVPEADAIIQGAVADIIRANPDQLSAYDTVQSISFGRLPSLAWLALPERLRHAEVDRRELAASLEALVLDLASRRTTRVLRFTLENLALDGEIPRFFGVGLVKPTPDER